MDDWVATVEALRVHTPGREVGPVVGHKMGHITGVRVGTQSAEGRDDPFSGK